MFIFVIFVLLSQCQTSYLKKIVTSILKILLYYYVLLIYFIYKTMQIIFLLPEVQSSNYYRNCSSYIIIFQHILPWLIETKFYVLKILRLISKVWPLFFINFFFFLKTEELEHRCRSHCAVPPLHVNVGTLLVYLSFRLASLKLSRS